MQKFILKGPARLKGEISVKGAKNSALKILPASLLSKNKITIKNIPLIQDIERSVELLKDLGAKVEWSGPEMQIETKELAKNSISASVANKLRASIMFVAPILARTGEASFPHPGGCVIGAGSRPIDLFLEGFSALGAKIRLKNGIYELSAKRLKGCEYFFTTVSVTGTESMILSAVLADGFTVLKNCAMEPEIFALSEYLNRQGAKISGAGTPTIKIIGVKELRAGSFTVVPDRIEAGTFAILAAATKSRLEITDCIPGHIESLLAIFRKIGIKYSASPTSITVLPSKTILPYNLKTHEYPGFPTDLQSPYTVLMTQAQGTSIIHETIYDRRLLFTDMLMQMGADIIMCDPHRVVVHGPNVLTGRKLTSPDLRAGIAMLIAGLLAQGTTQIDNIYQIDRGYEDIDGRLRQLGAKIERVNE